MSLQHVGVVALGLCWDLSAQPDCTGYIRCAVQVLPAAIKQQHSLGIDGSSRLFVSRVMHNGTVALVAGNSAETLFDETFAHRAEGVQLLHQIPLGQFAVSHLLACVIALQPAEEPYQR